jgi:nitrite reductase/ring-hydroxylating ferredoxin subunit
MAGAFPDVKHFYFEDTPNVRFHIPYDLARAYSSSFREFAKAYGEGKIAAHGPHRDSWLDCPANGANLWFAIGPVRRGNGLTVYEDDYDRSFRWQSSGDIADGERLHKPATFDLAPGDGVLFHTDQVHGSELNRTNETRFVISFRITFDRPYFPNRHFHRYVHSGWTRSWLGPLAHVPAMAQTSYVRSLIRRAREKIGGSATDQLPREPETLGEEREGIVYVPVADVPVGEVRGVAAGLCVARLSEDRCVAFARRCPHSGADLANGWIDGDSIVCPWHNMPFDASSGRPPCKKLPPIRRVACRIEGEEIVIEPVVAPSAALVK